MRITAFNYFIEGNVKHPTVQSHPKDEKEQSKLETNLAWIAIKKSHRLSNVTKMNLFKNRKKINLPNIVLDIEDNTPDQRNDSPKKALTHRTRQQKRYKTQSKESAPQSRRVFTSVDSFAMSPIHRKAKLKLMTNLCSINKEEKMLDNSFQIVQSAFKSRQLMSNITGLRQKWESVSSKLVGTRNQKNRKSVEYMNNFLKTRYKADSSFMKQRFSFLKKSSQYDEDCMNFEQKLFSPWENHLDLQEF